MCNLNTAIRVDAKRYKISNEQLYNLHELYHLELGEKNIDNLINLLDLLT